MDQNDTNTSKRTTGLIVGGFIIVAVLILVGLFLPPVSLGQRLGLVDNDTSEAESEVTADQESELDSDTDSVEETAVADGVAVSLSEGNATITVVPQDGFLAEQSAEAMPDQVALVNDVFAISYEDGTPVGQVALPIPADAGDYKTLDLYGWDGAKWFFIPSLIDPNSQQIVSVEGELPQAMAMAQVSAPESASTGAEVMSGNNLPAPVLSLLSEVVVGELFLNSDGTVSGEVLSLPEDNFEQWLRTTNVGPVTDQAALAALLNDATIQENLINALVSEAEAGFSGINLDYQGVPESQKEAYTEFAGLLADALHDQGQMLLVTLGVPIVSGNNWSTGGQDWIALGEIADVVYMQLPPDPTQYDADDTAAQLMNWATRQVDRTKLSALNNAKAVDRIGETFVSMSNEDALANFGELQFVQGSDEVEPNETVEVALSGTANPLEWDGDSLTYKYSYEKDGENHEVWLGSEAALSHRIQQAVGYNLRGVAVRGLGNMENGAGYAATFNSFLGSADAPQPTGAAIVWTVRNENDSVLASESGNELAFSWNVGEAEGDYIVSADFALGDDIASLDSLDVAVKASADEDTAAAAESETASDNVAEEESEDVAIDTTNSGDTGDADAVVNVGANIRVGPGLTYGTLADGVTPGMKLVLIGRNDDGTWLNIVTPEDQEAWIFSALVTVNSAIKLNDLPVVEVAAPTVAAAPAGSGDGDGGGSAPAPAPAPVAVAPVANAGFELGGQSHTFANPQLMSYAGMNWIKFQHKWGPGDDPSAVAGRIQQAHANGFKVLLSIPGQTTYPSSIDFASYVDFLGGVAALGPDAIEVWNEMNIDFEWPAGQIDPTSYVNNMLAPAYNAIKSANPNVMVISGAPAPTGFFGGGCGTNGCDDSAYLAGMAAAGAANYMDCMGAHFNAGATPPTQSSGHPAGNDHYSWHFQPTLDLYYGSLGKPVCFTELGYLSGQDFGGVPSRFSWAGGTSVGQHAQWLAEAVSLAANSGKARMVIIFNVDFTTWGEDPQAGYAMIRPDGSCPACETLKQVMGG
jgi:hypothetical protein